MKKNISRLFIILHWLWRISFAVLICTVQISAQQGQQPPPEFSIGVFSTDALFTDPNAFPVLEELGVNYVVEEARSNTQANSQSFNLIASNNKYATDVINHYSNAIYKRWDAERDDTNIEVTGFKHAFYPGTQTYMGTVETYKGAVCWSTDELSVPVEQLLYGPNYNQDKKYSRLNYQPYHQQKVKFKVRYRIAFKNPEQLPANTEVCSLYVMYGVNVIVNGWYSDEYIYIPLGGEDGKKTLKVEDFPTDDFYIFELTYFYPDSLVPPTYNPSGDGLLLPASQQYADDISKTGIEFRLDWSGVGKLYIDYVEVCDIDNEDIPGIGVEFIENPVGIKNSIASYLLNYNTPEWNNIKYWYCVDEPRTVDYYYPMRRIDEIIDSIQPGTHLITEIYQSWNGQVNGDWHLKKYVEPGKTLLRSDYTGNCLQLK